MNWGRQSRWALVGLWMMAGALGALDLQKDIVLKAQSYIGSTYLLGGTAPSQFDCSGFVGYILKPYVPGLPRVSADMAKTGVKIKKAELTPGDLVFFATTSNAGIVSHVALYIGQDSIIHAISDGPSRGVTISPLSAKYWADHYVSASRVLPAASIPLPAPDKPVAPVTTVAPIQYAKGTYTGELKAGEPNGKGTLKLTNGDVYVGHFTQGQLDGAGTYTWKTGETYTGNFQKNAPQPAPTAKVKPTKKTYLETKDSVWETWEGFMAGDYGLWLKQQERDFQAFQDKDFEDFQKSLKP